MTLANDELELRIAEALRLDPTGAALLEAPLGPLLLTAYSHDARLWLRCKRVMKAHKLPMRDYEAALKRLAHEAERIPTIGGAAHHTDRSYIRSVWPDAPEIVGEDCTVPQNYRIEPHHRKPAIAREKTKLVDGHAEVTLEHVSINPILMTRRVALVSNKQWYVEIAHRSLNRWRSIIVPQGVALDHRRFMATMIDKGVMTTSAQAPEICAWLLAYWDENQNQIPVTYGADEMGWHGENAKFGFLLGHAQIAQPGVRTIEFHSENAEDEVAEYRPIGTLEGWLNLLGKVRAYPAMRIAVYGSLAAPLVSVLGIGNCLIDFACTTSKGKSTALRLADSCWRTAQEALPNWDTTLAAAEDRARRLNDLPLIIDETQLLDPQIAARFVYGIVGGRTRGRAARDGTERAAKSWRTVLMTSGEQPVSEHAQRAGAAARSLSILQPPLGAPSESGARLADEIRLTCAEHAGHAGRAVVRWLVDHPERWVGLRQEHRRRAAALRDHGSGAQARMADVVALLDVAAMVAREAIAGWPWPAEPPSEDPACRALLDEAVTHAVIASDDAARAWAWLASVAQQQDGRWHVDGSKAGQPIGGWLGKRDSDAELWCWYPAALRTELERGGFAFDSTLRAWRERKWLKLEGDRPGYTCKVSVAGNRQRLVCVVSRLPDSVDDATAMDAPPPGEPGDLDSQVDMWQHGD